MNKEIENKSRDAEKEKKDTEKIETLNKKADKIVDIMNENIGEAIKRGDDFGALQDKASELEAQSANFYKQAKSARRRLWLRNSMLTIIIAILFIALVLFVLKEISII